MPRARVHYEDLPSKFGIVFLVDYTRDKDDPTRIVQYQVTEVVRVELIRADRGRPPGRDRFHFKCPWNLSKIEALAFRAALLSRLATDRTFEGWLKIELAFRAADVDPNV